MSQSQVPDTWERGDPYEQYVGRWSRQVAPLFLKWLDVPAGGRWLDVGCGTGALCAAILDACSPLSVAGVDSSQGFLDSAGRQLAGRVTLHCASATALPLEDASIDAVVSGLVLNFIPDQAAALAEMTRVTGKGGALGAYVWDYAEKMELMRYLWDAVVTLDAGRSRFDEALRFPLCRPEALAKLFSDAKLEQIEVTAIDIPTPFASFDDYWRPFLGGQGSAPAYVMSLDESARSLLRETIKAKIPVRSDGSISMMARAWAIKARAPV